MRILDIINVIRFGVCLLRAARRAEGEHPAPAPTKPAPLTKDEVDALLAQAFASVPDAPDYKTSIVDLLKVLHQDSSLAARRELAAELGFQGGAYAGTAEQNTWLHGKVMEALARREFGGA